MTGRIVLRRVYAAPGADDGLRVLVDRLWPRGLVTRVLPGRLGFP